MATIKIKVFLSIGYPQATKTDVIEVEIPDGVSESVRENLKNEAAEDWAHNYIEVGHTEE